MKHTCLKFLLNVLEYPLTTILAQYLMLNYAPQIMVQIKLMSVVKLLLRPQGGPKNEKNKLGLEVA